MAEGGMAWQMLWCGIQEIIEAIQGIVGETRGCSINKVRPPWGTVTTGYMLGLQMPESGRLRLTQSDQRHRTVRGVAPSPHSLPCPHLVTLFSIVMDS